MPPVTAAARRLFPTLASRTAVPAQRTRRPLPRMAYSLMGLAVLVLAWSLGVRTLQASLPMAASFGPTAAFESLWQLLLSGELNRDILASLRRVGVGLVLALAAGVPIGLLVGFSRRADAGTAGVFQFLRMISPLSWMPLAVMVFGIGDQPIYFLLAITAVWPIVINTSAGVRAIDPHWMQLGASLSATRLETLRHIVAPAILGHVLTGLRVAIGILWILLVPCEMLGVTSGLGYYVLDTRDRLAYSELMAVVLFIGLLGWALDSLARALYQHWLRT